MTQKLLNESHAGGLKPNGDGTYNVVLISPGNGTSGFYSESMLRESGPQAFPAGTHSYVDHPTEAAPGRSVEKLLGIYTEAAHYEEGTGLVSRFKPMKHYKDFVEEVAPYTGLSIYAEGEGLEEEVDGQKVFMVERLLPNIQNTVDLVSYAGRGGHFAESLLESALDISDESRQSIKEGNENMALEDEVKSLISVVQSAISELTTARESLVTHEAEVDASKVDASSAVESAVAATRAVNDAELPEKIKESLHSAIAAGDYNVQPAIESALAIREEVLAEAQAAASRIDPLSENYRLGAPAANNEPTTVKGW
jgi:hypothetical protein